MPVIPGTSSSESFDAPIPNDGAILASLLTTTPPQKEKPRSSPSSERSAPLALVPAQAVEPQPAALPLVEPVLAPAPPVQRPAAPVAQTQPAPKLRRPVAPQVVVEDTTAWSAALYWCFELLWVIGAIMIAMLLWWQDGRFTLAFVRSQIPPFANLPWLVQWMVPICFTAGFLGLYPRKSLRQARRQAKQRWNMPERSESERAEDARLYLFLGKSISRRYVLALCIQFVNMATSFSGLRLVLPGRTFEFFVPITVPQGGIALLCWLMVIAGILALSPELIMRAALPHLRYLGAQARMLLQMSPRRSALRRPRVNEK